MNKTRCKRSKRLLSIGLSALLAFALVPSSAYAEQTTDPDAEEQVITEPEASTTLGLPGPVVSGNEQSFDDFADDEAMVTSFDVLDNESQLDDLPEPSLGDLESEQDPVADSQDGEDEQAANERESDVGDQGKVIEVLDNEAAIEVRDDAAANDLAVEVQATSAGSSIADAYDVHVNDFFSWWYNESLTKSSSEDFFKFQVPSAGKVTFKVVSPQGPPQGDGVGANVYVGVFNSYYATSPVAEETISKNNSLNTISGSVSFELTQGTYWVRVSTARWLNRSMSSTYAPSTGGKYQLQPSFASANETYAEYQNGSNNSTASASGPVAFKTTYRGQIAVNDTDDYYKISLSNSGRVVFSLPTSNFNYYLYDSTNTTSAGDYYQNGGHLSQGLKESGKDRVFYTDLSAGTYYLRVSRKSMGEYGTYTFKLTYTKAAESFNESTYLRADNSMSAANRISFNQMYYGQLSATDFDDYYQFTTGSNRTISVVVTPKTSKFDYVFLYITDQYGEFSQYRTSPAGVFTVTVPNSYSTYYVRFSISKISNYSTGAYGFRLYDGEVNEMRWVGVGSIGNKYYTGKAIKPKPKVTYEGRKLTRGKDYKLSYKDNKKAGTATVIVTGINGYYGTTKQTFLIMRPKVVYRTWIQGKSWKQKWREDGAIAGLAGAKRYIRYFKARIGGVSPGGGIEYQVNTKYAGSGSGWSTDWRQYWVADGSAGGNDKQRIETMKIKLYGAMARYYNVYYRVHAQGFGWMGWAKNGKMAGTENMNRRIEAVQVVLVKKKGKAPAAKFKGAKRSYKKAYVKR